MNFEVNKSEFTTTLTITDTKRLSISNAELLKNEASSIINKGTKELIINCENINFIDSSGFSALISTLKASKQTNTDLTLKNLKPSVLELMELMQLHTIFNIS